MQDRQYGRNVPKRYGGSAVPAGEGAEEGQPRKLILKEKIGEMMKYGLPILNTFPRRERFLADEMRRSILLMFRLSIRLEKKYYKKTTLEDLDIELATLKELVVMASERDYCGANFAPPLSIHQRETWGRLNVEIGKLIGGYKKSLADKRTAEG